MKKFFEKIIKISFHTTNYIFENRKIAKYKRVINALYILSAVLSTLIVVSQIIVKAVTKEWFMWRDVDLVNGLNRNLISSYITCIFCYPIIILAFNVFFNNIVVKIDSAKIFECVSFKDNNNFNSFKIKVLTGGDKIVICIPIFLDFVGAFFFSMFNSAFFTNGYFEIIFGRYLGSFVCAHFCSYLTIIFYALCCNVKKKELRKDMPTYIANKKKEIIEKQKAEKIANDKAATQKLLEQCGMKFFIKYYHKIKMIPLRDVEVDENYTPSERIERLQAAKAIIERGYSAIAKEYILQNYPDILNEDEIQQLQSIL